MLACNQPRQHTGFVRKGGRSERSPIVNVGPRAPMAEGGERHWSVRPRWHLKLCQWIQYRFPPVICHVLAKFWCPSYNLCGQIWISVHFQFASIHLKRRMHWVYVHRKHLEKETINHQKSQQLIWLFSLLPGSQWDSICVHRKNCSSVGITKRENEVIS